MNGFNKIIVGDLVLDLGHNIRIYGLNTRDQIGVVIDVLEPQIYDRGERILVHWSAGYRSWEKAHNLKKVATNEN
jgi:hypothetical protein